MFCQIRCQKVISSLCRARWANTSAQSLSTQMANQETLPIYPSNSTFSQTRR